MEQLGWGAVAGLAAALPVGVLMATQHMVTAVPGLARVRGVRGDSSVWCWGGRPRHEAGPWR